MTEANMIICQIGAREHYALAEGLHEIGLLKAMATDIWVPPNSISGMAASILGRRGQALADRYNHALDGANILSANTFEILANALSKCGKTAGWEKIMAHNRWFGQRTAIALTDAELLDNSTTVFAYSYGALEILKAAKAHGARTMLGQIDPGPQENLIIANIAEAHGVDTKLNQPDDSYWSLWREECELADVIVVNSEWSRTLLSREGIPLNKIAILPLIYEPPNYIERARDYPSQFTQERPLSLLFLGQVGVRKGVLELYEAMSILKDLPVHLTCVGGIKDNIAPRLKDTKNVTFTGQVPRSLTADYYLNADLMILPTHSDGFALTQLEAQARGLPLIVSAYCGQVVNHAEDGFLLPKVTPNAIAVAIRKIINEPSCMKGMDIKAVANSRKFSYKTVVDSLVKID